MQSKISANLAGGQSNAGEALCFDKSEFMKSNFSVDEFLHRNRNAPSLEQLRDNLGLYLKGLRASMIELINEDYADFVSLSANLVGLDQSLATIQCPLTEFRDEIAGIQSLIQENEREIRAHLEQKSELRELKRNLQSLKKVYEASRKLEDLLANQLSGGTIRPVDLERAALELIQLKFNEKFCASHLSPEQLQSNDKLQAEVLARLRTLFNGALKSASPLPNGTEQLERCLRIYSTLDACRTAEQVFREDVVAPYMSAHISEQCLQSSPQGLAGVYSKILDCIALHMTDLLRLQYMDQLRGFDFVVNSFWAEVAMRLETHMTSIFAPGNSDVFYAKYKCTCDFLAKIEQLLAGESAVRDFRQHKQTKTFMARWNLPVYFQICFQEIAGQFESVLEPLVRHDILNATEPSSATAGFQLKPFGVAQNALHRCWAEGVYLGELFPKFYKLNVQMVMRLSRWISDVIRHMATTPAAKNQLNRTNLLIALHHDVRLFIALLPQLQATVAQCVPKERQHQAAITDALAKSFANLEQVLNGHLSTIELAIVELLIGESAGAENMRQVNDLPRLYRKTNRDVPTRCSVYVEQLLRPLRAFAEQQRNHLGQPVVDRVLAQVVTRITADYHKTVTDVLTSVQKTEESLRRLRNLKAGSGGANTSSAMASGMSDDDKIRMQLRVDVTTWTDELAKLNFLPTHINQLLELNGAVEESVKAKESL